VTKDFVSIAETQLTGYLTSKISSISINFYEKEFSVPHFVSICYNFQEHNSTLNELLIVVLSSVK
jgi:hypothetical protein